MTSIHRTLIISWLVLLSSLLAIPARVHATITVNKYTIEVSWMMEPVVPSEINGVLLNIVNTETGKPVIGVTTLQLFITTGKQTRPLHLKPLGAAAPGHYSATFIPTAQGLYTVHVQGQIEAQAVDMTQQLDKVTPGATYEFPIVVPSLPELNQQLTTLQMQNEALRDTISLTQWLALDGIVLGFIGVVLGFLNRRQRAANKERPR